MNPRFPAIPPSTHFSPFTPASIVFKSGRLHSSRRLIRFLDFPPTCFDFRFPVLSSLVRALSIKFFSYIQVSMFLSHADQPLLRSASHSTVFTFAFQTRISFQSQSSSLKNPANNRFQPEFSKFDGGTL